jgi:hypothetical protein
MLMFTRTHARLAASDAKKIGQLAGLVAKLTAERDVFKTRAEEAQKVFGANLQLALECEQLRMRLKPFIAPRERDDKGRFQPVKSTIDHMIDALEAL